MFKTLFNFAENFMNFFTIIGFQFAKGINKVLYGLIFSSFDKSKEEFKIEKARIDNEMKELENKRKELEIDAKHYDEKMKTIKAFLDAEEISEEDFVALQEDLEKTKKKLKKATDELVITKSELEKKTQIASLVESLQKRLKNRDGNTGNEEEVLRLQREIQILENEINTLKSGKGYLGETVQSKIKELVEPTFEKTKNPIKLVRNWINYRKQLNEFKKVVNQYVQIDKKNAKNSTARYKFDSLKEQDRSIELGDKHIRIYYLKDVPNYLLATTLFKLINIPIPLTLSYHIKGTSKGAMIKAARQRLSVLESVQNDRAKKDKSRDQEVDKEMDEVNIFINNLVHDTERVFLVSIYAVITADSKKELMKYDQKFQDEANDIEFTFNVYSFGQQQVFPSTLPMVDDTVKAELLLQTSAVTNLLPFLTRNLNDPEGIFIGTNHYNGSLILVDPFKARNANFNIFGTSGSGKSVTAKLLMTRLTLRGIQNIILDPEGEYGDLAEHMGGEVIKFERGNGINPFFIGKSNSDAIKDHVAVLKHFFKFFIQEDRYDSAKLDKLLMQTYDSAELPTFKRFLSIVKSEAKKDKEIKFVEDLEQLSTGSLSGLFDSEKPIRLDSDVIIFDLSQLGEDEKKIPAMYLLGAIIKRMIFDKSNTRRRMVWIDEAHKLLVNPQTTIFYVDLVKTARKYRSGVVSITQNPEDFKEENNAKAILTQSETSILLKQAPASINYVREKNLFLLTERELADLPTFGVGEALFIRESEHIYLNVFPFESEKEYVFTS